MRVGPLAEGSEGDPPGMGPDGGVRSADRSGVHRPQALLFAFFGGVVYGRDLPPIPSVVFLCLLSRLGVAEAAARASWRA